MKSGIGRPIALATVLVAAVLETTLSGSQIAVRLCGVVALVLCGWAIPLVARRPAKAPVARPSIPVTRPPETAAEPSPALTPLWPEFASHTPPAGGGVAVAAPAPTRAPVVSPAFPGAPLFGPKGAAANRYPWLLPRFPAASGVQADEALVGLLQVRAASVVGPGHRCEEPAGPRQDAYRLARDPSGRFLVVAVADGLSSGGRSDLGADVATRAMAEALAAQLRANAEVNLLNARDAFARSAAAMTAAAGEAGLGPADLSSVLIAAVIDSRPDQTGAHPTWISWIGDSSAWILRGDRWQMLAGDHKVRGDGLASNEVNACLPQHPGEVQHKWIPIPPGSALAVVTDGVGDALGQIPQANAHMAERWARPGPLSDLLDDISFDARQHLDDRTAVVIWTPESRS